MVVDLTDQKHAWKFLAKIIFVDCNNPLITNQSKILVVRFSSIGDIVLTTPVLRCIKKSFPHCTLHFLTKPAYQTLLKPNPFIDGLHLWEGKPTIKTLQNEKFDFVIDLHRNLRTRRLKWALRSKHPSLRWRSFNKINFQKWLSVRLKSKKVLPNKHIVHRYLQPVLDLGVQFDNKGLDFFIESHNRIDPTSLFPNLVPFEYHVYAIGGQHETKKLPRHKQIELLSGFNFPIVLIGGKEDKARGEDLSNTLPKVYNACGRLNIQQSAHIIEQCRKVLTHDTGMMHIAAALLKPIISIWGNTIPEFGMSPFYPSNFHDYENRILEVNDVFCRPCSKIGFERCPWGHFKCMNAQDFNDLS